MNETFFDYARPKMMRVWGGDVDMNHVFKPLHFLMTHMHAAKFNASLDWLLAQGLSGKKFVDFFFNECEGSTLELQRYLLSKIEKKEKMQLIAGKDVIV